MVKSEIRASDNIAKKSRRRKKRRTTEVSDTSSSSEAEVESDAGVGAALADVYALSEDEVSDLEEVDAWVANAEVNNAGIQDRETLSEDTKSALNRIPFTKTKLTEKSQRDNNDSPADLERVGEAIEEAKQQMRETQEELVANSDLKNSYLELLFENFGDDINSLRSAPDFTNNSLVMLAHLLKDGAAMFDVETLKTMLETK
ncbi:RSA3 (YLR221C) [Zygosaccharomyces parabailii]|nr:RSA3 (YLR221C) [Zygosaccharomyces parabailii]CDH09911.1 uncharacterized protein ZBAI_01695 [Zygosaccharomyces bailii ISA1307]